MSPDIGKAYELLGVKPGVSPRELKAAHRDLAKVWHPDRFGHDPRLQQKAQEKLKEINEAYELLISGKTPESMPPKSTPSGWQHSVPRTRSARQSSPKFALALLAFMAMFAVTISILLNNRAPVTQVAEQSLETEPAYTQDSTPNRNRQPSRPSDKPAEEITAAVPPPVEPLPTVTVVIDARTGLLATPDCPLRSKMTYPSGAEPHAYCDAAHSPKTNGF